MALWKLKDHELAPGEVVAPDERVSWPKTIGLGAQHVVAMFGATFVFPLLMGLNPQLAVMMSGIATLIFLFVVSGKIPSYLGSSASFVGIAAAIRALPEGNSALVTGATLVGGLLLMLVGICIHFMGAGIINRLLPPAVTGAVVMIIGFNLAPVVSKVYWPQDQWVAVIVMLVAIISAVAFRGFLGRIAVFLSLVVGYTLSWVFDKVLGPITSFDPAAGKVTEHFRVNFDAVTNADWIGFPPQTMNMGLPTEVVGVHAPQFSLAAVLLVVPAIIALIAENTGHVKAVAEMTDTNLDKHMGKAIAADGFTSMMASSVGAGPTTTYAENIGVMAATRVYSTAAYVVAAFVAIGFGFSPKFGAVVAGVPGGVLGGITVVLYGMIGLLGAKIWKENEVDFANPINLVPIAAGVIIGIGDTSLQIGENFTLGGIAFGTIVVIGAYHLANALSHAGLQRSNEGSVITFGKDGSDRE